MTTGKIVTDSLTILSQVNGRFALHFGFFRMDDGSYYCYERTYVVRPTLALANKHIAEVNVQYCISEEEWEANTGRVQNI